MDRALSTRGSALAESGSIAPYFAANTARLHDAHHPTDNPDGYIGLCVAENKLVWDLLAPQLTASRPGLGHDSVCYDRWTGCRSFRDRIASFMAEHIHGRRFDTDQIAVLAGAGSVLEALFYCLADSGEAVLVPTPSYAGFWGDLQLRDELAIVPVHTSSDAGFALTEDLLDAALAGADRPVRALLYTNPDNPRGAVADRSTLEMVVRWAAHNEIHLVVDELYALSVFGDVTFTSVAALRDRLGDRIHLVWAFSKDFGASGLRCGVLVTENAAVMRAVDSLAYWAAVSGSTQHLLERMLSDEVWVEGFIAGSRTRLAEAYRAATAVLDAAGIGYIASDAGVFFLVDLRSHLPEQTWEGEDALWRRMVEEANLNLTPGSACRNAEPGFFRVCFASQQVATAVAGMHRLVDLLAD